MKFEFSSVPHVVFGPDTCKDLSTLACSMGSKPFLVTGSSPQRNTSLISSFEKQFSSVPIFEVKGEPTISSISEGVHRAREMGADVVVGVGGGSVIDTGKAIAVMLTNDGELIDYLEVIGAGRLISKPPYPYIAVPTTAGTGAEVTQNAVIASPRHHVKVSLRSSLMLPRVAVVDPRLTISLPSEITGSTGLDALTQLIEAYVSNKANPLTDALCREGIGRAAKSLLRAVNNGSDIGAREDMALASLFSGFALANAKLGAVHGLAGPLGGILSAPHGGICGVLLPHVVQTNINALLRREPGSPVLKRYDEIAAILTDKPDARAEHGVKWIHDLCAFLKLPTLRSFGLSFDDIEGLVIKSKNASSMKGNPITLTDDELTDIVKTAW